MTREGQVVWIVGSTAFSRLDVIDRKIGIEPRFEITGTIKAAVSTLESVTFVNTLMRILLCHGISPHFDHWSHS